MFDLSGPHGTQNSSIVGQGKKKKKNTYVHFYQVGKHVCLKTNNVLELHQLP